MNLVINENNLNIEDINEFSSKVRCILLSENNEVLVCNYGGTYLLPGGKIDGNESQIDALIRELHEETGIIYDNDELKFLFELNYYQKNYPKRDSSIVLNRLVTTYYYFAKYKEANLEKQILSDKELKSNFRLELINFDNLESVILNNQNSNPRNIYFQKELLTIIKKVKNKLC